MRISGGKKLPCSLKRAAQWIIDLNAVKGNRGGGRTAAAWRRDLRTTQNENFATWQERRRVVGTSLNQRSSSTEMTGGRVEDLRATSRVGASYQQYLAVGE